MTRQGLIGFCLSADANAADSFPLWQTGKKQKGNWVGKRITQGIRSGIKYALYHRPAGHHKT